MGLLKEIVLIPIAIVRYPYKLIKLGSKGIQKGYNWNKNRMFLNDFEDLKLIGMDFVGNQLDQYEKQVGDRKQDIDKTREKINKQYQDMDSLDEKITKGEAALEKMKSQKSFLGSIFVKASKKYRVQKNLLDTYKKQRKEYPDIISQEYVNLKTNQSALKKAKKELKKFKSEFRKEVRKHQEVIDVVKYYYKHKDKFIEMCHEDVVASIESEMQEIRDNHGKWTFRATPREYLQSLKESIKKKSDIKNPPEKPETETTSKKEPKEPGKPGELEPKEPGKVGEPEPKEPGKAGEPEPKEPGKAGEPEPKEPGKVGEPKPKELGKASEPEPEGPGNAGESELEEILGRDLLDSLRDDTTSSYQGTVEDIIAEVKRKEDLPTLKEQLERAREKFEHSGGAKSGERSGGKHLTKEEKAKEDKNARRREKRAEAKRIREVNVQSLLKNREQLIEAIENERTPMIRESFIKELRDIEEILGSYRKKVEPYCESTSTIIDKRREFLEQLKVEDAKKDEKAEKSNSARTSEMHEEAPQQDGDGR